MSDEMRPELKVWFPVFRVTTVAPPGMRAMRSIRFVGWKAMQMTINTGRNKMNKWSKCGAKIMTNMKLNAMDEHTSTTDKVNSKYLQQQQNLNEFKCPGFRW